MRSAFLSKHSAAILLPSSTRQGPWGDHGWRPCGIIQYVKDGPDWLWSGTSQVGVADPEPSRFDGMVVRDTPDECAADIVVMTLALFDVPGWRDLEAWWDGVEPRSHLLSRLRELAVEYAGEFKIGVVRVTDSEWDSDWFAQVADSLLDFEVGFTLFDETL